SSSSGWEGSARFFATISSCKARALAKSVRPSQWTWRSGGWSSCDADCVLRDTVCTMGSQDFAPPFISVLLPGGPGSRLLARAGELVRSPAHRLRRHPAFLLNREVRAP